MKSIFTLILTIVVFTAGIAQNPRTTYFDFAKTKIDEQYYVNAKGEKNGAYKRFWNYNGVRVEEATFLNGELHGTYKKYDPTSGKALLTEMETYSRNIKNGEAKYYSGDGYTVLKAHGYYVDGKKEGVWTYIEPIEGAILKGYKHCKTTETYKAGELVSGGLLSYYHPAGKLYQEKILKDGKLREVKSYYPSGKLGNQDVYDSNERLIQENA
jgi:antitoxin component YwqK of YwqJK toxin-antitoxin module